MVSRKLKSVLALVIAMAMLIGTIPMFVFAENADTVEQPAAAEAQSAETDDSGDGSELNFMIDENGDKVELTDEMRAEIYKDDPADQEGIVKADADEFFGYDDSEVQVASAALIDESFEGYEAGTASIPGWTLKSISKSGAETKATIAVADSPDGKALQFKKNKNGVTFDDRYESSDEYLYGMYNFPAPVKGKVVIMADAYVQQAGRIGLFFYGKSDDIDADLNVTSSGVSADEDPFPYLGRAYFWDSGKIGKDPVDAQPSGMIIWDDKAKKEMDNAAWELNKWYSFRFDVDTDAGTYDVLVADKEGNPVCESKGLALQAKNLEASQAVYGVAMSIQGDTKSLGDCYFKNIKVIDNNTAEQDAQNVVADMNALSLPVGLDASAVTEDFSLPTEGTYGSAIKWSSSNPSVAAVDANGNVKVTRPEYSGAASITVRLTANLTNGLATSTRDFDIDVLELPPGGAEGVVEADKNLLELPAGVNASSVTEGFTLPTKGSFGSVYTYESSDPSILSIDNSTGAVTVTRPVFSGAIAREITITATIAHNGVKETKPISVSVKELEPSTDAEKALFDVNSAFIGGIDITNVRQSSFFLDDKGTYGSLSWESADTEHINITKNLVVDEPAGDGEGNEDDGTVSNQGGYKAEVTRPDRNQTSVDVTLTVTSNVNGATASKEFVLTVIKDDALKAFPGVEGYGAYSTGGRGGQVYHVTNLNHDGEGSLTYGLEQVQGARTIVFDVGGVIDLTAKGEPIVIKGEKYSNVTIAGQTAPYPGITLKGYGLNVSSAHDVIIRNIKIRIGDVFETGLYNQSDPMSIGNAKQVVVDHCSLQWAVDMNFRATGEYITLSNIIFGKNMVKNSSHEKGGHAYVGMINEGARKVTFTKNFVGDSTQRSPRITDADWIDAYNNLLYNSGNGFDICNYEWQDKNAKMNVYSNFAKKGPALSNASPYRVFRGRAYSGGIMCYFEGNYGKGSSTGLQNTVSSTSSVKYSLNFGEVNHPDKNNKEVEYDLSNMTLDEWNTDPRSYDNNNKSGTAATFTYMTYPFPAPRGDVYDANTIPDYAADENGMGATRPSRDLYDTMIMKEMQGGTKSTAKLSEEEVTPFFEQLEMRTGQDYSPYKTARSWRVIQGVGPVLKGAGSEIGKTKPVHWDDYTDVNKLTNPDAATKYESECVTDFEVTDWWGQYCGSPGQQTVYTLYDTVLDRTVSTTSEDYDQTRYQLVGTDIGYVPVERTVTDLIPSDWMRADYPEVANFLDKYREEKYPYTDKYSNYSEYKEALESGNLDGFKYDTAYTSKKITWDGMGDGIPNWYKEYRGWSTVKYLASEIGDSGYTYLEEYLQMMAGDEPLEADSTPASIKDFKVNNLGYSTAQVFWNTDYRASCVLEYGTEPGVYTNSIPLTYTEQTDYYHTYHAQTLVGLEPNTQYYYKVTATDENSAVTVAEYNPGATDGQQNMTFTTAPLPSGGSSILPTKPTIENVVPYIGQVRIEWNGDYATDESYEIYYDTTDHGQQLSEYTNKLTGIDALSRKQIITGLENGKTYYCVLAAVNSNGKTVSDSFSFVPSGTIIDFDFTKMTEEEKAEFMKTEYMYVLGGQVSMQNDPDTGENVLQMLDETNSHGVNMNVKFPRTQTEKFTYEVTMKVLYQKQTDALNGQFYEIKQSITNPWKGKKIKDENGQQIELGKYIKRKDGVKESDIPGYVTYEHPDFLKYYETSNSEGDEFKDWSPYTTIRGTDEHNSIQLNFAKDTLLNGDMDSTASALWETAFSIYLEATTRAKSSKNVLFQDYLHNPENNSEEVRYDGTYEEPIVKFSGTDVGTYNIGQTPGNGLPIDDSQRLRSHGDDYPLEDGDRVLPSGIDNGSNRGTGYAPSAYKYTSYAGDAVFSHNADTDKTLHALWYYQKNSAKFVTYKVVVDPLENNIRLYADGVPVYESGTFSEDMEEPYNIGKVEIKSRNDGFSWVNIARIRAYAGDGSSETQEPVKPISPGQTSSIGGGYGGGGGGATPTATATPAPTEEPTATAAPTAEPAATTNPAATKYFDDIANVEWAVEPINALTEKGIITGTGDRQFSPNDNVTRAEYATMLMRAYGDGVTPAAVTFTDTAQGEWYTESIGKAVALGVTNGYDNGAFGINDKISREDMMVMAYRTMEALNIAVPKTRDYVSFADQSSLSDYAAAPVEAMYCAGIINGVGDNMLDPKGNAERAQAAKIIYGLTEMEGTVNE